MKYGKKNKTPFVVKFFVIRFQKTIHYLFLLNVFPRVLVITTLVLIYSITPSLKTFLHSLSCKVVKYDLSALLYTSILQAL